MASEIIDITQAITDDINGASWDLTFTAERKYLVPLSRSKMGDTNHVHVFPLTWDWESASRGKERDTYGVIVMFRRAVDNSDTATIDALIEQVEDIVERYQKTKAVPGYTTARVTGVSLASPQGEIYDIDELSSSRVFVSGILIEITNKL